MADNIIPLRPGKCDTAEQVLEHASKADLEHIMVVGIKRDGENYFNMNGTSTLLHDAWMLKCAERSINKMLDD